MSTHEHQDGIQELDNQLPRWWLASFYITIVFGIGYFGYYVLGGGPSLNQEYAAAQAQHESLLRAQAASTGEVSEDELAKIVADSSRQKQGHEIFEARCASCHGAQGGGGIGPNLTDNYWLHGGKPMQIAQTITNGVLEKGMPSWGPVLSKDQIHSLVAFVRSIRGTNPAGGKAPQGELEKD